MLVALLGIVVGLSASLLGIGGNLFIIPFLPLLKNVSLLDTIAVGIASVCLITGLNSYFYIRANLVDKKLVLLALPFSAATGFIAGHMRGELDESLIEFILVGILGLMLFRLLLFKKLSLSITVAQERILIVFLSIISGLFAGLVGIGNGVLLGPAILSLNLVDHQKISPSINVLMFINSFFASAALFFTRTNTLYDNWTSITVIVIFAIFSAYFGRKYNSLITVKKRKVLISSVLVFTIIKLLSN